MTNQNIYIVEDTLVTRMAITSVLKRAGYKIVGNSASAEKAWLELPKKKVEVLILDINLTGSKDGIWLAKKVRASLNCAIIFLTAYGSNDILEKIYCTEPDAYIMKPFNNPTLLSSIRLACRKLHKQKLKDSPKEEKAVFMKSRTGMVNICSKELIYLKSESNYVHLYTHTQIYEVREKLSLLLQQLDFVNVFRIHRRYAVNAYKVDSFGNQCLRVNGTKELAFSQSFQIKELKEFMRVNRPTYNAY